MTTKVTVDAHAGWPVKVTSVSLNADGTPGAESFDTVPPNSTRDFCVHSHLELHIKEMPNEPAAATGS